MSIYNINWIRRQILLLIHSIYIHMHSHSLSVHSAHDNLGFFYSRYSKPESIEDESKKGTETDKCTNQQLWYHKVGTKQEDDIFLIDAQTLGNENWMIGAGMTWCGKWLEIYISLDCDPVNRLYLMDISDPKVYSDTALFQKSMIRLVDNFDAGYSCINNEETTFYFKTNAQADNYRIVSCDVAAFVAAGDDAKVQWTEVVPEREFRMETAKVLAFLFRVPCLEHVCSQ